MLVLIIILVNTCLSGNAAAGANRFIAVFSNSGALLGGGEMNTTSRPNHTSCWCDKRCLCCKQR